MTAASSPETVLDVRGLTISFVESDGSLDVLDNLSFQVQENSFVCLIGPSGGGKSTLLRAIGGLLSPTSGQILFPQQNKGGSLTGMVFQKPNLMPWRTVLENMAIRAAAAIAGVLSLLLISDVQPGNAPLYANAVLLLSITYLSQDCIILLQCICPHIPEAGQP